MPSPARSAAQPLPLRLGKYFVLEKIAESPTSVLYRGRIDVATKERWVALKAIHPRFLNDSKSKERLLSEISTAMSIQHPSIARIYEVGEEDGTLFISMEWISGLTLRQVQTRTGPLPSALAAWISLQIARALEHAHSKMSHRDLSPQRVLLPFGGGVKIIGFGITSVSEHLGKAGYVSPEQLSGLPTDARCDLFALASILWELLTADTLLAGQNHWESLAKTQNSDAVLQHAISKLSTPLPEGMVRVLARSLSSDREKRYPSAKELAQDLAPLAQSMDTAKVTAWLKSLFASELGSERSKLQALQSQAEPVDLETCEIELEAEEPEDTSPEIPREEEQEVVTLAQVSPPIESAPITPGPIPHRETQRLVVETPEPKRKVPYLAVILGIVVLSGLAFVGTRKTKPEAQRAAAGPRSLTFDLAPVANPETTFHINGQAASVLERFPLLPGFSEPIQIKVQRPGYQVFEKTIDPASPENESLLVQIDLLPIQSGTLSLTTEPPCDAAISNGTELWLRKTPFLNLALPPGSYTIKLQHPDFPGEPAVQVPIREGSPAMISHRLGSKTP